MHADELLAQISREPHQLHSSPTAAFSAAMARTADRSAFSLRLAISDIISSHHLVPGSIALMRRWCAKSARVKPAASIVASQDCGRSIVSAQLSAHSKMGRGGTGMVSTINEVDTI